MPPKYGLSEIPNDKLKEIPYLHIPKAKILRNVYNSITMFKLIILRCQQTGELIQSW